MNEKIIAVMPIKLNNERLPGKNTKLLGGKPLLRHELDNLSTIELLDEIFVFCSQEDIVPYLPDGVYFAKRPQYLDMPTSNFTQIFEEFLHTYSADIYVYAHATAPFITVKTMRECIEKVQSGEYDSAFCATKIQDYLWQDGQPMNFDAENVPRSQDLAPVYRETSGIYVFTREVFEQYHRRVGKNPFVKMVTYREAVDINDEQDFRLAEALLGADL